MATMVGKQKDIADLLNALIELDFDAVEAYDAAIERLEDSEARTNLSSFREDHARHTRELQPLVQELGEKPAEKADVKSVLTKGKVVLGALVGDRMILEAMKTNEDDTNTAYERAVDRDDVPPHIKDVLVRNREDERRHRDYIVKRLESYASEKEEGVEAAPVSHPPTSAPPR